MQMPTDLVLELRNVFVNYFNEEELSDFALALGVDYENIAGNTKNARARELALYLYRHSLLSKLAQVGPEHRDTVDWLNILGKHGIYAPVEDPVTPAPSSTVPKIKYIDLQRLSPILGKLLNESNLQGRSALLTVAGVRDFVNVDLNGPPNIVAAAIWSQLNDRGRTPDGDLAISRLLHYLQADSTLPDTHQTVLEEIVGNYQL